jgi:hypothetical protein
MRFLATLTLVVACGCTAANPHYSGAGGNNDFGQADLSATGPCTGTERTCLGAATSGRCQGGGFVSDRACPAGSQCQRDYCAPPPPMLPTQVGQRCDNSGGPQERQCSAVLTAMLSCQPFVDPGTGKLRFYCDQPVGAGGAAARCKSGGDCHSGVCSNDGTCFYGCQSDFDCPAIPLPRPRCTTVDITVEGVTESVKSCTP